MINVAKQENAAEKEDEPPDTIWNLCLSVVESEKEVDAIKSLSLLTDQTA